MILSAHFATLPRLHVNVVYIWQSYGTVGLPLALAVCRKSKVAPAFKTCIWPTCLKTDLVHFWHRYGSAALGQTACEPKVAHILKKTSVF